MAREFQLSKLTKLPFRSEKKITVVKFTNMFTQGRTRVTELSLQLPSHLQRKRRSTWNSVIFFFFETEILSSLEELSFRNAEKVLIIITELAVKHSVRSQISKPSMSFSVFHWALFMSSDVLCRWFLLCISVEVLILISRIIQFLAICRMLIATLTHCKFCLKHSNFETLVDLP